MERRLLVTERLALTSRGRVVDVEKLLEVSVAVEPALEELGFRGLLGQQVETSVALGEEETEQGVLVCSPHDFESLGTELVIDDELFDVLVRLIIGGLEPRDGRTSVDKDVERRDCKTVRKEVHTMTEPFVPVDFHRIVEGEVGDVDVGVRTLVDAVASGAA